MRGRVTQRMRTDCAVVAREGALASACRGVDISSTGIVVDRGRPVGERDERLLVDLEISFPERLRAVRVVARPVWSSGTQQGFRFVRMSDADRLDVAEHVDHLDRLHAILH